MTVGIDRVFAPSRSDAGYSQRCPDQDDPDQELPDHDDPDQDDPDQDEPFQFPDDHEDPDAASGAQVVVEKGRPKMSNSPTRATPAALRWSVPLDASRLPVPVGWVKAWEAAGVAASRT